MSPTQRTLRALREQGWLCAVVERWNSYAKIRQDLFGFIDILAIRGDEVLGVQCTTTDNVSARISKIVAMQSAKVWLDSPHRRIIVQGWAKRGPRGARKLWTCITRDVTMNMMEVHHDPRTAGED